MSESTGPGTLRIDFVSDVVCPWCIIGYRQLCRAIEETGVKVQVRWHPFELNPDMPPEGQNMRAHLAEKYGTTTAQSQNVRDKLTALGNDLGFAFNFHDDSRMVNTFLAHQLIEWSEDKGRQMDVKLELFEAFFTQGLDVSDIVVLAGIAARLGLDPDEATEVLSEGKMAWNVRAMQKFWIDKGISGVPAMVFESKHLVSGAQGTKTYASLLRDLKVRQH